MVASAGVVTPEVSTTDGTERPLPAALTHALAAFDGPTARTAERVVRTAMAERLTDGTPRAWQGSRLTGDGFPVEVAFCTADDTLRLTLEPGRASCPPSLRLDRVNDTLVRCGGTPMPEAVRLRLAAVQAGGPMRYGAWLGCRIAGGGRTFKLYVEVPPARALGPDWPAPLVLADRDVVPRMVAVTQATGLVETYLRVPSLLPEHLPAVLNPVGLSHQSAWLLRFIEEAYGHAIRGRIPGPSVGISYVVAGTPRVSLHLYARALWGSDARIRRGFLRVAQGIGWDSRAYEAVSGPLAAREDWRCYQGLFGITLSTDADPAFTIGLRPVSP
ncbi:MAG: hypothetical protein ABWY57_00355 [Mycetocola sp.]